MIKLTPEHVGTRVLMSDGDIGLIDRFHGDHVSISGGLWIEFFDLEGFHMEHGNDPHFYHVTLLLDAPNPLDVEIPDWCKRVATWRGDEATDICVSENLEKLVGFMPRLPLPRISGWSPAPGQLPPRKGDAS